MRTKRHPPEEIVAKLRQVDGLVAQGTPVADAIRAIGVTEVTYYRWRQEYGGLKSNQVKRMKALETENARLRKAIADLTLDKLILQEAARGNLLPPRASARRCRAHPVGAEHLRASRLPGARSAPLDPAQSAAGPRGRRAAHRRSHRAGASVRALWLSQDRGLIAALLRDAGWVVNDKRVERIWRREGLKVPPQQPQRRRLWLADGSCIRLRPEYPNHVWSYDFVEDRTHDGRKVRLLNVIDEFTHECLAIRVDRKLKAIDVIDVLADLFILRGVPTHLRSDNGPEFGAKAVQRWITAVGAKTAYIERGSPWENGFVESFNARLRDELLDGEIFYSLQEAQVVIESWRRPYNTVRPHASLGYRPPAPEVFVPAFAAWPAAPSRPAAPARHLARPPVAPRPTMH
jgi:putative transposase